MFVFLGSSAVSLASCDEYGTTALLLLSFLGRDHLMRRQEYLQGGLSITAQAAAGAGCGGNSQDDAEHGEVGKSHEVVQARVVAEHGCLGGQHKHPAYLKKR